MRILDFNGDVTHACFQFEYKGFLISCSNLLRKNLVEVVVFGQTSEDYWQRANVPDAMALIDNMVGGK